MFFGSGNVFANINPAILYEEEGIKSYIMAGSSQPIWNTCCYIREAFKSQHPKLVVIDMKSPDYDVEYFNAAHEYRYIWGLRPSKNKLEANEYGVERVTNFINRYLKENYDLPDCRGQLSGRDIQTHIARVTFSVHPYSQSVQFLLNQRQRRQPVHSIRRESLRKNKKAAESDDNIFMFRPMAWSGMELCDPGGSARFLSGCG